MRSPARRPSRFGSGRVLLLCSAAVVWCGCEPAPDPPVTASVLTAEFGFPVLRLPDLDRFADGLAVEPGAQPARIAEADGLTLGEGDVLLVEGVADPDGGFVFANADLPLAESDEAFPRHPDLRYSAGVGQVDADGAFRCELPMPARPGSYRLVIWLEGRGRDAPRVVVFEKPVAVRAAAAAAAAD